MFKKTLLSLATLATISSPVLLSASQESSKIVYDNFTFNSEAELFNYYLNQHPEAINTKTIIGDIDQSIIDYDYGLLDGQNLRDYDGDKLFPAYVKNNGNLTPSLDEAKASFANPALIQEYYQGPSEKLYDNEDIARQAIIDDFLVFQQSFYTLPSLISSQESFTYNPLSNFDYNALNTEMLVNLQNQNDQFNNQDYQKIIANADTLPSLVAYTDYAKFDKRSKTPVPMPEPTNFLLDSWNMTPFNPLGGITKIKDEDGKINPLDIRVYPFKDFSKNDNEYWSLTTPAITNLTNGDDSRLTSMEIKQNDPIVISNNYVVDQFLANADNALIDVEMRIDPLGQTSDANSGNVYLTQFDLGQSSWWLDFATSAQAKIAKVKRSFGSAIDYQLMINFDQSNSSLFDHYFEDGPGTSDYHYLRALNPENLEITLVINDFFDPDHILVNITDHFLSYYNQIVNVNGQKWNEDLVSLFTKFVENPYWINRSGQWYQPTIYDQDYLTWKNMTSQILNENIRFLKAWSEIIVLQNEISDQQTKLFSIKRNWNQGPTYGQVASLNSVSQIDLAQLQIAFWQKINDDDVLSDVYIGNYLLKDVIYALIEDMVDDRHWEPTILQYDKIYATLANIDPSIQAQIFDCLTTTAAAKPTILDALLTHIQNLTKYLTKQKNNNVIIDANFMINDALMQKRKINFQELLFLTPNNQLLDANGQLFSNQEMQVTNDPLTIGNYLFLDAHKYNFANLANDPNKPPLFTNAQALANYCDQAIISKPRVVRVLYDLDGNIIWGSLTNNFVYDSISLILFNVANQIKVQINPNVIFYQEANEFKLLVNHRVRIYTWQVTNQQNQTQVYYFLNHASIRKYIIDTLLLTALIIN